MANPTACEEKYSVMLKIFNSSYNICTAPSFAPCHGDGPLLAISHTEKPFWYIAGISSYGKTICGDLEWPNVSTKVSAFNDWIMKNIRA